MHLRETFLSMLGRRDKSAPLADRYPAMAVEALEPRVLHSADAAAALVPDVSSQDAGIRAPEVRTLDVNGEFVPATTQAQHAQTEIVFVDTRTPDYQKLVDDIHAEAADGRAIEVVLLDNSTDGIKQITDVLASRHDIGAIHIVSHGSDGAIQLGGSTLDLQSLQGHQSEIASWGNAMSPDADLLIYGCDVAASAQGRAFVDALSRVTGADVAASENLTGSAAAGGDWNLEYATGAIQTGMVVTLQAQSEWIGLLGTTTIQADQDTYIMLKPPDDANNFGASSQLIVDRESTDLQRILLKFDLSAIPTGATITSASLQMQATAIGGTLNIDVYELLQSWDEGSGSGTPGAANWTENAAATNWATAGGSFNSTAVATLNTNATGQHSWDITSLVQGWVDGSRTNNGVLVASPDGGGNRTVTYDSREGTFAPQLVINYSGTNTSPVLSGAENMPTITEDPAGNPGTTVATLIGGHVTDADAGALTGIAVTGVDNTNGSWQYSINAGGSWSAFTSPSDTNATLLRSTDLVRFVPNADWNGTVANGLTFRAWDQTTGTAGSTANAISTTSTVRDNFSTASYNNNDGSVSWSSDWVDDDGNPSAGAVQISGGRLQLQTLLGGGDIHRSADLTNADTATLSFDYDNNILLSLGGNIALQVSNNGGASYTTLTTFSSADNTGSGTYSADISAYISGDTRIQFVSTGLAVAQSLFIDNLQISYTTPVTTGTTAFSIATASSSIDVTAVNDPPAGTNGSVTTAEDSTYTFALADFGYSDTHDTPANNFLAVTIATVPGAGSLTLNGVALGAGQSVSATDIAAGKLQFTPAADANGAGYASFTFQVQDDGGGTDLDPVARTMSIVVTSVNDAPGGADHTVSTTEDTPYVFGASDFGFSDARDTPANNLAAVKITALPAAGSLTLNGVAVSAGQFVSTADIAAGKLKFTGAADASATGYASFTFQVQDDGGGADLDPTARTMTIDVTAVNDAPVLVTNVGLTVNENSSAAITAAQLHVTDVDNTATQLVFSVTTPPANGHLELASAAGVAITSFTEDDIDNNQLVYVHDGSQTTSDGFSFTVSDGAGGSIGTTAFAITVNAVNDAPVNTVPGAQATAHDTPIEFSSAQGNALSVSDADAGSSVIKVTLTATNGKVTLATTAGLTFSIGSGANDAVMEFGGSQAAINTALDGLIFAPTAGYAGSAALSMVTNDLGNTGSGGALTASSVVAINITAPPGSTGSTPAAPPIDPGPPITVPPPGVDTPVEAAPTAPSAPGSTPVAQTPVASLPAQTETAPNAPYEPATESSRYVASDGASTRNGRLSGSSYALPAAQWLMGSDDAITGIAEGSGSSTGLGGYGDGRSSLQSPALLDALDRLRDGLQDQSRAEAIVVASTAAASLGLSVGYVLWLLRGGVLVSSMLSSLPAWRMVDPLPILGRLDEDEDEDAEDDSLESIVASGSASAGQRVQGDIT